jgi:hypothetical protein
MSTDQEGPMDKLERIPSLPTRARASAGSPRWLARLAAIAATSGIGGALAVRLSSDATPSPLAPEAEEVQGVESTATYASAPTTWETTRPTSISIPRRPADEPTTAAAVRKE